MKNFRFLYVLLILVGTMQSCMVSKKQSANFFNTDTPGFERANYVKVNVPMWLAKPIVKNALRKEPEGLALIGLLKKVSDIQVFTVQNSNPELNASFTKFLDQKSIEPWVSIKKDEEIIDFSVQRKANRINKFLLTVKSGTDLVYVDISGKFTEQDLSELINYAQKNEMKKSISKTFAQ